MNELALFAGAGGGILGGEILGWRTVCAVEHDPYVRNVLVARQNDRTFPPFPIWDDVFTFDGRPWRGVVDVVSAGFPCQPFSVSGKLIGADDPRNGWPHTVRIIREVRPRYAFLENVPGLITRFPEYFATILSDLAEAGYDAEWTVLGADDAYAPHRRKRLWILAYPRRETVADPLRIGLSRPIVKQKNGSTPDRGAETEQSRGMGQIPRSVPNSDSNGLERMVTRSQPSRHQRPDRLHDRAGSTPGWVQWPPEPGMGRVVDGLADRAHRIRALGNGQVPRVVAMAWRELISRDGVT